MLATFKDQNTDRGDDSVGKVSATQHEDWDLDPCYPWKKLGLVMRICNPDCGGWEQTGRELAC